MSDPVIGDKELAAESGHIGFIPAARLFNLNVKISLIIIVLNVFSSCYMNKCIFFDILQCNISAVQICKFVKTAVLTLGMDILTMTMVKLCS